MRGVTSLEQFLDEHTEKRSDIAQLLEQNGIVLPPARSSALAAPAAQPPVDTAAAQHLRWNGVRVSPEFERYAERVARGEELEPFRGRVLASGSAFPWNLGDSDTATTRLSEPPGVVPLQLTSGGPANGAPVLPNALPAPANATLPPLVIDAPIAGAPAPWNTAQRAVVAALVLAIIALGRSALSVDNEPSATDDIAWPNAVRALRPSETAAPAREEPILPRPESVNVAPVVTQNVPVIPNFAAAPVGKLASRSARAVASRPVAKALALPTPSASEATALQSNASEVAAEAAVAAAAPSDLFVHEAPF